MSNEARALALNEKKYHNGDCIVYVMSRDQRVADNHALLYAQEQALEKKLPLVVLFNLYPAVRFRQKAQYQFMLQGLAEVKKELDALNIALVLKRGESRDDMLKNLKELNPAAVYFDFSPLRGPRALQKFIAEMIEAPCFVVDTYNIVPVWITSTKQEYAARTIRPKIKDLLLEFTKEPGTVQKHPNSWEKTTASVDISNTLSEVTESGKEQYEIAFRSGAKAAHEQLKHFLEKKLQDYEEDRNDPSLDGQSDMSPYLHFGQISSLRIVLELRNYVNKNKSLSAVKTAAEKYEDEIIVRKELADNFCFYNDHYDSFHGVPDWGKRTLNTHRSDKRETIYTIRELEESQTHDEAWNAAMNEARRTGKMHGYMRMYWAKKILEWTETPEQAIEFCIYLNDTYHIDGHDPNGYSNILWSIGGLHDRPWAERPIFGYVRYMNYNGLKRKFNIEEYIKTWKQT